MNPTQQGLRYILGSDGQMWLQCVERHVSAPGRAQRSLCEIQGESRTLDRGRHSRTRPLESYGGILPVTQGISQDYVGPVLERRHDAPRIATTSVRPILIYTAALVG